jgi:hypothetical protein
MASVHPVLLNLSWLISVLIQTQRRIDRRSNQPDRRFVRCYWPLLLCFFQSSDTCRNWTIGSSDGASWLEPSRSVPSTLTHTPTLVPRYHRFFRWCLFFSFLCSDLTLEKYIIFSFWHVVFLHPWDLEMSTKTCSSIWLVSLIMLSWITKIILELMACGHVRYNLPLFGDLWQHKQSKHKLQNLTKLNHFTCLDAYPHPNSP